MAWTSEMKRRVSEARKGANNPFFGKRHTETSKKKIGDRKHWTSGRTKKISENHADVSGKKNPNYGNHKGQSEESNRKRSQTLMNRKVSFETRQKQSKALKGRKFSKNSRDLMRKAGILRWDNIDFQSKMLKAFNLKPNKPEQFLIKLLEILYPNDWRYVGDFQFWLGGKNPDFMNVNGQKKLIELYGDYWHKDDNPQDRIDHFKQYGFDTLVIWQSEFESLERVKFRIHRFCRRR